MKRVLEFPIDHPKSARRFEFCRIALLQAGDGKGARDRATIRQEARLLEALDAISTEVSNAAPCQSCGDIKPDRILSGGRLELAAEDHTLLARYLDSTPWLPRSARDAVDVQDFVDAAAKVD